jgi:hypothetical protein
MLIDCTAMDPYRNSCELANFISAYRRTNQQISSLKLFARFLNDHDPKLMQKRALSLYTMQLGWHHLMQINM